jgi:acyl carrier protein
MEIEEFVQNFADQFDDTSKSEFYIKTCFRDIEEWSSLRALMIIAMVDEVYKVGLNGDDIRLTNTIEDIYNIIKSRK